MLKVLSRKQGSIIRGARTTPQFCFTKAVQREMRRRWKAVGGAIRVHVRIASWSCLLQRFAPAAGEADHGASQLCCIVVCPKQFLLGVRAGVDCMQACCGETSPRRLVKRSSEPSCTACAQIIFALRWYICGPTKSGAWTAIPGECYVLPAYSRHPCSYASIISLGQGCRCPQVLARHRRDLERFESSALARECSPAILLEPRLASHGASVAHETSTMDILSRNVDSTRARPSSKRYRTFPFSHSCCSLQVSRSFCWQPLVGYEYISLAPATDVSIGSTLRHLT